MLPIQPEHNYAACGGPLHCRYCAAILTESGERRCERITAEDRARGLRAASERRSAARDCTPPDPYANDLKKLRADLPSTRRWPDPKVPSSPPAAHDFTPPDPYQAALDKMRSENR